MLRKRCEDGCTRACVATHPILKAMFERYTEQARRVIFWARHEAAAAGSEYIEPHHLLLAVLHESPELVPDGDAARAEIGGLFPPGVKTPRSTSVDLPLSQQSKRILACGAEEAERLNHRDIRVGHLLLGILREPSGAGEIMSAHGVSLEGLRSSMTESGPKEPPVVAPQTFTKEDLHRLIEEIPQEMWGAAGHALLALRAARGTGLGPGSGEGGFTGHLGESVRRSIFFARYEASQMGSPEVNPGHLFLGLLREDKTLALRFIPGGLDAIGAIRRELESGCGNQCWCFDLGRSAGWRTGAAHAARRVSRSAATGPCGRPARASVPGTAHAFERSGSAGADCPRRKRRSGARETRRNVLRPAVLLISAHAK